MKYTTYISDFSYFKNIQNYAILKLIYGTTLMIYLQSSQTY